MQPKFKIDQYLYGLSVYRRGDIANESPDPFTELNIKYGRVTRITIDSGSICYDISYINERGSHTGKVFMERYLYPENEVIEAITNIFSNIKGVD